MQIRWELYKLECLQWHCLLQKMWDLQQITHIEKTVEEFKSEVLQLNSSFLPENKVYRVNAIIVI